MRLLYTLASWIWFVTSWITAVFTIALVKFFVSVLNTCNVHHEERLYDAVVNRSRGRPLITIMNHRSFLDAPLIGKLLRWRYFMRFYSQTPWIPHAKDIGYRNLVSSTYFSLIGNVPMSRGGGIFQPSMDFLIDKLSNGGWAVIFPEGRINRTKEKIDYKLGISRLIVESKERPIILPIYHLDADTIIPNTKPLYPRIGKRMSVLIGEPIHFCAELEEKIKNKDKSHEVWTEIARALHVEMDKLEDELAKLH